MKKALSLFLTVCLAFSMFIAVAVCSLYDSKPGAVVYAAEDDSEYDLNWDEVDLTVYSDRQKDETPEPTTPVTPIIIIGVAGAVCVALGAALVVQKLRKKAK